MHTYSFSPSLDKIRSVNTWLPSNSAIDHSLLSARTTHKMKIISIRRLFERITPLLLSLFPFHFVSLFHTVSLLVCFDVPVAWLMFGTRELNIPRRSIPLFHAKYRLWISEIVIKNVSLSIDWLVKWSTLNHTKIIVLCSRGSMSSASFFLSLLSLWSALDGFV